MQEPTSEKVQIDVPEHEISSEKSNKIIQKILEKDEDDESLVRYKKSLLGSAAFSDSGVTASSQKVIVEDFKVIFEDGSPPIIFSLATPEGVENMHRCGFSIPEGAKYKFEIYFRVNGDIVSGLTFENTVRKHVFREKDKLMLGSYPPQQQQHQFVFPRWGWAEAPKGLLYRGKYHASSKFIDQDNVVHLEFDYYFGK